MAGETSMTRHPQQLFFDNVSPQTRLLEKRRQMYEVQDALENQKAKFAKEEETFKKREEHLRTQDLHLQHQLFRFNKFLQDNEAKRRRAETRAAEEAAQIRQKEEDIRDLEHHLDESKQLSKELEEEVARNMKYEEFLESVKDTDENFQEIQDLVTRYDTLESANKDLMRIQTESEHRIEELRNDFQNYRKEQEMDMLAFTNRIATLSSELDETIKEKQHWDQKLDETTQEDSKHSLYVGQILMSVENLFLRCTTKRKNIQHAQFFNTDEDGGKGEDGQEESEDSFRKKKEKAIRQLKVILAYLKDFKDITDQLRNQKKVEPVRRGEPPLSEAAKLPELAIRFEAEAPKGDRTSQNSGSAANTREFSKQVQAPPSVAVSGDMA
mmetsp:Transcript_118169/g.335190  ORF Transcript_118169/g.335190 Transcript_118169/m.335190 type:complete len:383 (-) Transcript_118169:164-1312(-)